MKPNKGRIMIRQILLLTGFLLFGFSCEEDPMENKDKADDFSFRYTFRVKNAHLDTTLNAVTMECITYYPVEDKSNLLAHVYNDIYKDSLYLRPDRFVYDSCITQLRVRIHKNWTPWIGWPLGNNYRTYVMPADTVFSLADSVTSFSWPEDTIYAIHKFNQRDF